MIDLTQKTALITGASRGIGLATAEQLARCGAKVVLAARSASKIDAHAARLQDEGHVARAVTCDVTDYEQVSAAVDVTMSAWGRLDILINNAGIIDPIEPLIHSNPQAWGHVVDVNLKGVYHGLRAATPHMRDAGGGTVVNLSSGAANSALESWSHYCSTKAAVKMLTQCAHKELAPHGIVVVGLSPGTVATDMMASIRDSGVNPVSQLDWSTHIGPHAAARAIAFLCGPEGHEFSGTDFSIKTPEGRARVGLDSH